MAQQRYRAAAKSELEENGSRVITEIDGKEICIFNRGGEFYAMLNYCVHQAGPLCEGPVVGKMTTGPDRWEWNYTDENRYVMCPWHRWKFDITTGRCASDDRYRVPTFEVEADEEYVYLHI